MRKTRRESSPAALSMLRRMRPNLSMSLVAAATLFLAWKAIAGVLERVGHPGAALDDSFIHFQYARAIAEGHPLRYQVGEPVSTGATSVLWPLLLAPFYAIGFRELAIVWPAWGLSFVALGLLAWDAAAIAKPLGGAVAAVISPTLVLTFGGHVWCAASGMEVVPFAWIITRTMRRAMEWSEGDRSRRRLFELVACANLAALLRPEGAVFTLLAAGILAIHGASPGGPAAAEAHWSRRLAHRSVALTTLIVPAATIVWLRVASGSALTNTAVAKLLFTNPYLQAPGSLREAIQANFRIFFQTLLQGEVWSAEFIPAGGAIVALLGLGAVGAMAIRRGKLVRGALIIVLALAMLIPCFYVTFLWNRLRYLWPFATGWLIGLGCLAQLVGELAGKVAPRGRLAGPILGGLFVGLFAAKLPWVLEDIAQSVSGIDRQHVAAGRWAKANLPAHARIGMNDAGAIAYFGDRKTFDIVGLTTTGEARYWTAGVASRFEHYEKMPRERLPTHFIAYPEWLGGDLLLGRTLADFVVTDSTILGGQIKRAAVANWTSLGSGELPWSDPKGAIVDTVDVADLESEAEHGYVLGRAREGEQTVRTSESSESSRALPGARATSPLADGGRTARRHERFFTTRLAPGRAHHLIVRVATESMMPTRVHATFGNTPEVAVDVPGVDWTEVNIPIAPEAASAHTATSLVFDEPVTVFHYWFVIDG